MVEREGTSLWTPRSVRETVLAALGRLGWLPPLLARITIGVVFVSTGWGKVHNLGKVTEFFARLGIPAPSFNAALVGYCELICGMLLLLGLATRFATVPLIVTMIVALATAKAGDIHGLQDLLGTIEFVYIPLLVYLALLGPGALAVDIAIAHAIERMRPRARDEANRRRRLEHRHA